MFRRLAFPFLLFAFLNAFTKPAGATNVREFALDNGLEILLLEDHKRPAVTLRRGLRELPYAAAEGSMTAFNLRS
jgi:hypothetical protein